MMTGQQLISDSKKNIQPRHLFLPEPLQNLEKSLARLSHPFAAISLDILYFYSLPNTLKTRASRVVVNRPNVTPKLGRCCSPESVFIMAMCH